MLEHPAGICRTDPALLRFSESTARSTPNDSFVRDEMEEIRGLCSRSVRVSHAQIIPENALLADALSPERTGPAFLEVLPIEACNHGCAWCFTAAGKPPSFKSRIGTLTSKWLWYPKRPAVGRKRRLAGGIRVLTM